MKKCLYCKSSANMYATRCEGCGASDFDKFVPVEQMQGFNSYQTYYSSSCYMVSTRPYFNDRDRAYNEGELVPHAFREKM